MDNARIILYIISMIIFIIALNMGAWVFVVRLVDRLGTKLKFTSFVGIKHLRGRKSGSLTIIGLMCIIAVSASSCTLTTVLSVMGGFSGDLKSKILSTNAHIVIDNFGAHLNGLDVDRNGKKINDKNLSKIKDWHSLIKHIEKMPEVKAVAPLVQGEVMINAKSNNNGMLLKGVNPTSLNKVSQVLSTLSDGKLEYIDRPDKLYNNTRSKFRASLDALEKQHKKEEAENEFIPAPVLPGTRVLPALIVGKEMGKALRLYVGEEVKIISPLGDIGPTGRIPKSRPFRVGGMFFSGMYTFDEHYAYTSIKAAQDFLNTGDSISEIHIIIDNPEDAPAFASQISSKLGGHLRVRSWQQLNAKLFSALKLEKIIMFILMSIAIAIASFSIIATLTMLVLEKGPEISVLMTIGATSKDVKNIFKFEGLMIGSIGSITGLIVGFLLCTALMHVGLPIPPDVWYIDKLPVDISFFEFLAVGATCLSLTVLATLYPAHVASKITPVEGLKK